MKTKIIFTALQADNAGAGEYRVAGAVGLYLVVGEVGKGSYVYRYRLADRRREMGLGSRDAVSLADARKKAVAAMALKDIGVDPIDERKRVKLENIAKSRVQQPSIRFERMTMDFLRIFGAGWKHRNARTVWLGPMVRYAFPMIGDLGLDDIKIPHITAVMQRAKDAGASETAYRVRVQVWQVLNHQIALSGKVMGNPAAAQFHPKRSKREPPHFRAVEIEDAREVFQRLKAAALTSVALSAWVFMVLTASRPSEALNARWEEVDQDRRLWTVPATRMKSGRAHQVPLSPAALEVLERQMLVRTGDSIFPGRGGSPLSYATFTTAPSRAGIAACTPHGWRSVFRDWAGDIGDVEHDLAEFVLAHSLGKVEGSYRKRTAVERRRSVMTQYAEWLNSEGRKVIALDDHRPLSRKA